jgi:hypothetical protein
MAVITNTFTTASPKGNRESLSDVVSRITPEDTPIYSMISKESTTSIFPEWEIDTLAAPAANAQLEGDIYTFAAITPVTRVGNYTQIMRKDWVISKTQQSVDNAGQAEQEKTVKLKRAIELKKDTELAIISNAASVAGATRVMGGLPSWYATNVSRGAGGANGGYNTGTKLTVAATTGTQRAFTKALLDTTMQASYVSGANIKFAVVSPYVKSVFVTFMSDTNVAPFRMAVSADNKRTIIATADYYEGPFGRIAVVPNRVMATSAAVARRVHLIDDEMLAMKVLRKIASDPEVTTNADSKAGVIIGEHTLCVKNEAGLGSVEDVFGLTVST